MSEPHLRHYGVDVLGEGDLLEELLLPGRDVALLRLDVVLRCRSNQDNQHGLTGHVHLKHTHHVGQCGSTPARCVFIRRLSKAAPGLLFLFLSQSE